MAEVPPNVGVPLYEPTGISLLRRSEGFGWVTPYLPLPALVVFVRVGGLPAAVGGLALGLALRPIVKRYIRKRLSRWAATVRRDPADLVAPGSALLGDSGPVFVPFDEPYPAGAPRAGIVVLGRHDIRLFADIRHHEPLCALALEGLTAQVVPPKKRGATAIVLSNAANDVSWWWVKKTHPNEVRRVLHTAGVRPHLPAAPR